jgi:putative glutamine amidotransferase
MGAILRCSWWYFILLIISAAPLSFSQETNKQHISLVITHPTRYNLENLAYLLKEEILPLNTSVHLKLLYHSKENYDYAESALFLKENPLPLTQEIIVLDCELKPEQLFAENECSNAFRQVFEGSDAIIFFGGPDLVPAIYGEETHLLTVVTDPYRHYWEASMLFHLLGGSQDSNFPALLSKKPEYAILGICLGMQTMNVATGGTMVQDIPSEIYQATTVEEILGLPPSIQHRNYFTNLYPGLNLDWASFHPIVPESTAAGLLFIPAAAQHPVVLSSHHQAVERLGKDLLVLARSEDGQVIEMIGHQRYPHVLGVQFHPEVPALYNPAERFRVSPEESDGWAFGERYPGMHLKFHRDLWRTFSSWIQGITYAPSPPSSTEKNKTR